MRFVLPILCVGLLSSGSAAADPTGITRDLVKRGRICEAYARIMSSPLAWFSPPRRSTRRRHAVRILKPNDRTLRQCKAHNRVARLQALAGAGKPARATLRLATTIGWGCPCPPLVFAKIRQAKLDLHYIYPLMKKGVPDIMPATRLRGQLRVKGRFTALSVDRYRWSHRRRVRLPPRTGDRVKHYKKLHPLFIVSWWCFIPPKGLSAEERKELRTVIPRRRFCRKKK